MGLVVVVIYTASIKKEDATGVGMKLLKWIN